MNIRTKVPTSTEQVTEQVATAAPLQPIVVHQPEPPVAKVYPPKIAKAIIAISKKLAPVEKHGFNDFHKYRYPKWEDVAAELFPEIVNHGLIITQSEIAHGGFAADLIEITYEFTIINEDGDVWPERPPITAICKVRDKNGTLDDKAASKCFTQAAKYMYISLFKIRIQDAADADADPKAPPPKRRAVPTSTGKIAPYFVATVKGDTAASWAKRFLEHFEKSETEEECQQWDTLNDGLLVALSTKAPDTYNAVVDAMTAKAATFQKKVAAPVVEKKVDPISTGPAGGFPGDKPIKTAEDDGIPAALRRTPALAQDEQDWLHGLGGAFSGCEDLSDLADNQQRLMTPQEGKVSQLAWDKASELLQEHLDRLGGE